MFSDPVFIIALLSLGFLIGLWIHKVLADTLTEPIQQTIYTVGFLAALLGIYRIFVNAGDLGVVLLLGSISPSAAYRPHQHRRPQQECL